MKAGLYHIKNKKEKKNHFKLGFLNIFLIFLIEKSRTGLSLNDPNTFYCFNKAD